MSIASEISRISNNVQNTIDAIEAAGVTVPEGANSDNLPSLAQALANTKQDKLTGAEGQVVGFDADGNAVAQDLPDGLPEGGTEGQVLTKTASGAEWADAPQINDAIITDANPWSAKKIVDTLAPEFETSGAVVTCTPVAGYPLHVVSQIMPVQGGEGDPSPDNVRPISGWDEADLWVGGANLFNPDNLSGGQLTELDGVPVYQFRDGATGNFMFPVPNIKNQQFTLRLKLAGTATQDFNFVLYYSDGSYDLKNIGNGLGPYTITSSAGKTLTSIQSINGWNVIRYIDLSQTMLVVGLSVPADFSPYRGQTITLPFGQTVYGGTLDWTTGVMTVDWVKYVATGQENVLLGQTFQANHRWYFNPPLPTLGNLNQRSIQCNVLKTVASGNTDQMGCVCTGTDLISVLLPKDTVPDKDSAKKWLQDNQPEFVYKTSQVENVQLTPTEILALSGTNTIYTDTGDTTVSGRADPNTIIQQLATRIATLERQAING